MPLSIIIELSVVIAAFGCGIYAWRRLRARSVPLLDGFGLRWDGSAWQDLLAGLAITALAMLGIFAVEYLLGTIQVAGKADADVAALPLLAVLKFAAIVKEELIMRSLLLTGLLMLLRQRAAAALILSALAFGLIHLNNPGATVLSIFGNAMGGLIYGLAFIASRRIWLPLGLHFSWNFVQGPLLGFPVSGMHAAGLQQINDLGPAWITGGAYGPEGGLVGIVFRFAILGMLLLWIKFSRQARRPGDLPLPTA